MWPPRCRCGCRSVRWPKCASSFPKWIVDRGLELEPSEAPPGISLSPIRPVADGVAFDVKADCHGTKAGFETNLIIDVFATKPWKTPTNPPPRAKQRSADRTLPAIPIILTPPNTP